MFLHSLNSTALLVVGIDLFLKLEVLANFPIRSSCNCHISAVFSTFSVCSALTWLLPYPPWEPGVTLLGCGGDHLHQEKPTSATQHLVNFPISPPPSPLPIDSSSIPEQPGAKTHEVISPAEAEEGFILARRRSLTIIKWK